MPTYFDGQLVFVHIPKCAGNSVNTAMGNYQFDVHQRASAHYYRMHESLFEIQNWFLEMWGPQKWEEAAIVSTIRHPVERAVSWWKYKKRKCIENHALWLKECHKPEITNFNFQYLGVPYFSPADFKRYHGSPYGGRCIHVRAPREVKKYNKLSFNDFVSQMTVWGKSGCDNPYCPYHAAAPQVNWLSDVHGQMPMDRLNLFLVDQLHELGAYLPQLGEIGLENVSRGSNKTFLSRITISSLITLQEYYAEDFKLYEALKNGELPRPEPIYLPRAYSLDESIKGKEAEYEEAIDLHRTHGET